MSAFVSGKWGYYAIIKVLQDFFNIHVILFQLIMHAGKFQSCLETQPSLFFRARFD